MKIWNDIELKWLDKNSDLVNKGLSKDLVSVLINDSDWSDLTWLSAEKIIFLIGYLKGLDTFKWKFTIDKVYRDYKLELIIPEINFSFADDSFISENDVNGNDLGKTIKTLKDEIRANFLNGYKENTGERWFLSKKFDEIRDKAEVIYE